MPTYKSHIQSVKNISHANQYKAKKGILSMKIEPMNFVNNLKYMASGMLGIFIVIGIIVIITMILNKVFSK